MNRLTRVGIGIAAISLCYTAATAAAGDKPDGAIAVPGGSYPIPEHSADDAAKAAQALGQAVDEAATKTRGLPAQLQVPAGADSMQEGLWHLGPNKWGSVRIYYYSTPVDIAPRQWRSARTFKGEQQPHFAVDSYGVIGLREVSVYVDVSGRVVAVQPTDYDGLSDITFERNPSGAEEVMD